MVHRLCREKFPFNTTQPLDKDPQWLDQHAIIGYRPPMIEYASMVGLSPQNDWISTQWLDQHTMIGLSPLNDWISTQWLDQHAIIGYRPPMIEYALNGGIIAPQWLNKHTKSLTVGFFIHIFTINHQKFFKFLENVRISSLLIVIISIPPVCPMSC